MAQKNQPAKHDPNQRIELDLNSLAFQKSWFSLEKDEQLRVLNLLEKISQLTWVQVYRDIGMKWEAISESPIPLPEGITTVYSLRITQARRAVAYRDRNVMRMLWIAPDHDSTYGSSRR